MLTFLVYESGRPAEDWSLRNAHLLGAEDVGVRANIRFENGLVIAEKFSPDPAALVLQYEVPGLGEFMLQTCLLPDRPEPYLLTLELARHRLTKIIAKQEDWALFDIADDHPSRPRLELAKRRFTEALNAMDNPVAAEPLARQSLAASLDASEELSLLHADVLLGRRVQTGSISRYAFGGGVSLGQNPEQLGPILADHFDYVRLSANWRTLQPREKDHQWQPLDRWCDWAVKHRVPIVSGPLLCFSASDVPDWFYVWEHDYEALRDMLYEHIERTVHRYRNHVSLWNVASGLHVNSQFPLSFEQISDLTRMAVMLVKKVSQGARTLIEITQPFGEYYAMNPRSIPPVMYAEMLAQSGIPFDAFGLKVVTGHTGDGLWTRDLLQLSAILDRFNGLGKPLHVSGVAAPSEPVLEEISRPAEGDTIAVSDPPHAGYWRKPWSPQTQAHWAEAFYKIALSKPFVESVAWLDIADHPGAELPFGGLVTEQNHPKAAIKRLDGLRKTLHEPAKDGTAVRAAE